MLDTKVWCASYLEVHGPLTLEGLEERHNREVDAARAAAALLATQRDEYRQLYKKAHADSLTDTLTGLPNVRATREYLANLDKAGDSDYAIGIMDVDSFKRVNDKEGHQMGDSVLVDIAGLLKRVIKRTDFVARTGGDEFTLVLHGLDADAFDRVTEQIQQRILAYTEGELGFTTKHGLNISLGFAHRSAMRDIADVTQMADDAMYAMKQRHSTQPEYTI